MKVKAILYDLGDVFFEAHLWREWMFHEFSKKKLFRGNFAQFYNLYDSFLSKGTYTKKQSYKETFNNFLKHMKVPENERGAFEKRALKKKVLFEKTRKLYPEVKRTLIALKKHGIKNVVITDNELGGSDIRKKIIGRYGINKYIDHVITSKDCGLTKSNKKIFKLSLKKIGFSPAQVLFVGHDQDEIENAQANKILTVEYNNYLKIPLTPDYKISKFSQLLNIVK